MPCSDGRAAGIVALATLHLFSLGAAIHCPHSFIYLFWVLLSGLWALPTEGGATGTGFFLWGETSASAKKETNAQKEKGCVYKQNGSYLPSLNFTSKDLKLFRRFFSTCLSLAHWKQARSAGPSLCIFLLCSGLVTDHSGSSLFILLAHFPKADSGESTFSLPDNLFITRQQWVSASNLLLVINVFITLSYQLLSSTDVWFLTSAPRCWAAEERSGARSVWAPHLGRTPEILLSFGLFFKKKNYFFWRYMVYFGN